MESETSRRRYSRSPGEEGHRKRRDRSPSSDGDHGGRRQRRYPGADEPDLHDRAPRSHRDSKFKEDSSRPRKDDRDDRDSRRREHHRKDNRDRSRDDRDGGEKPSRRERDRDYRNRSRSHRRRRSRSPAQNSASASPPPRKSRAPLPSQDESFRGDLAPGEKPPEKQKPNFKPTGLLAKEANTVVGTTTVLKYHEPPEARKPSAKQQWRMYVFKKRDLLETIQLYTRSAWLMGRDEKVTDLFLEHPSISKQHAVIQFRHRTTTNEYGDKTSKVKPYLIDLESAKGTKLNGKKVETSRYLELVDGDVIGFGESEREYVMMLPSDK